MMETPALLLKILFLSIGESPVLCNLATTRKSARFRMVSAIAGTDQNHVLFFRAVLVKTVVAFTVI
jgi:hypothetical protein